MRDMENWPDVILPASRLGMSSATRVRKVGAAAPPEDGPAKTTLALWVARLTARVPLVVIGEPVTDRNPGTIRATLVTVPVPAPMVARTAAASASSRMLRAKAVRV